MQGEKQAGFCAERKRAPTACESQMVVKMFSLISEGRFELKNMKNAGCAGKGRDEVNVAMLESAGARKDSGKIP